MTTALVLGANGFVGPWLTRELMAHGCFVCASDVQLGPCALLECDSYQKANLLDPSSLSDLLSAIQPDQVYNLAAVSSVGQSWRNPALTMRVNVEGVVNLLQACRCLDPMPKVLLVGSSEEYAPSEEPLTEISPIAANNPYGISKEAQGRIADMYYHEYGMPIYRVRAFNHTGPGQASSFVLPSWCKQVAEIEKTGRPGTIRVGNLRVVRDFSDVRDIVRAYRLFMESDYAGQVINVGSGKALDLHLILDKLLEFPSVEVDVKEDQSLFRPSDNPVIQCDHSVATKLLGWVPSRSILDTLGEMYRIYLKG